jgi:YdcK Beta solenoid repeat
MKYEFTGEHKVEFGVTLRRIRSLVTIDGHGVLPGDLGGWVEKEDNLSHEGKAWVDKDAWVFGNARVYGNAWIMGKAKIYDEAHVYGDAWVTHNARIYGRAGVFDNACIKDNAQVYDKAGVKDSGKVLDAAQVYGDAVIFGHTWIRGYEKVGDFSTGLSRCLGRSSKKGWLRSLFG